VPALDRTQPMLPLRPGLPERQTRELKRHGTVSLFGALEIATGRVTHDTHQRHKEADFLAFLKRIARAYREGGIHFILDNVSTHKTPAVRAWLEKHLRFHFHFTPTSASWMNLIEIWFRILTRQAIRRGSFNGVHALIETIDAFTSEWNDRAAPFAWVKTADEILAEATWNAQDHSGARH
jgi:transposase